MGSLSALLTQGSGEAAPWGGTCSPSRAGEWRLPEPLAAPRTLPLPWPPAPMVVSSVLPGPQLSNELPARKLRRSSLLCQAPSGGSGTPAWGLETPLAVTSTSKPKVLQRLVLAGVTPCRIRQMVTNKSTCGPAVHPFP